MSQGNVPPSGQEVLEVCPKSNMNLITMLHFPLFVCLRSTQPTLMRVWVSCLCRASVQIGTLPMLIRNSIVAECRVYVRAYLHQLHKYVLDRCEAVSGEMVCMLPKRYR